MIQLSLKLLPPTARSLNVQGEVYALLRDGGWEFRMEASK